MLVRFRNAAPSIMNDFFRNDWLNDFSPVLRQTQPAVNIIENENGFEIEVVAPGWSKENFAIKLEKKLLTITGDQETQKEETETKYLRREFARNAFSRSFLLSEEVEEEQIAASYKQGILKISVPKKQPAPKVSKLIEVA